MPALREGPHGAVPRVFTAEEDLLPCQRRQDIDQLLVRRAGRIAELADRMRVHQPAEPQEAADTLALV